MEKTIGQRLIELLKSDISPKLLADEFADKLFVMGSKDVKVFVAELVNSDENVKILFSTISFVFIKKLCYLGDNNLCSPSNETAIKLALEIRRVIGKQALNKFVPDYNGTMREFDYNCEKGKGVTYPTLFVENIGKQDSVIHHDFSNMVYMWIAQLENTSNPYLQELGLVITNEIAGYTVYQKIEKNTATS